MSADTHNLSHIQDEDVLRKMWQDTEDFGKKKEIRSHMYKLREQRLREFYNGSEITESRSSKTTGKVTQSSTHADSLVDQSFQSFKSKEVRDSGSGSPTRDIHYKVPGSNEWQIASNNEISKDGKTRIHSTVASVQGTQKIDGGQIDFKGKNENTSSVYHHADENSETMRTQSSSHSSTASRMVQSHTVPSEQIELPSNLQGVTKVIRETKTLPDGSKVTTTRYDTTSGSSHTTNQSAHVRTSQESSSSRQVNERTSENVVSVDNKEVAIPSNLQGITKVTKETKTLPNGTTVISTRYNTTSDNIQTGHIKTAQTSSTTHITGEKQATLNISTQNNDNITTKTIKESKILPETYTTTSVTNQVTDIKGSAQNRPQVPENLQGVTKITKETKTLPDGSIETTTKYHTVSGTTTHTEVIGTGKISKEHSSVTNKSTKRFEESVDNQQNYKTEKIHSVNNKITDNKDIIRTNVTSTQEDNRKNFVENNTKVTNVNENINITRVSTDDKDTNKVYRVPTKQPVEPRECENIVTNQHNRREEITTDNFINTERRQEVLTRDKYPEETPKNKPSAPRDISPTKPTKTYYQPSKPTDEPRERSPTKPTTTDYQPSKPTDGHRERSPTKPTKPDYQPSKPTDGQYETTYRTDYTNRKISVEVSPTHDAFARSLRSVSPDRVPSRGSHRTSNSSIPEKMRHPSRISPERTHKNRGGSPTKSNDRFSSTDTYIYNKRRSTDEGPKTKSPSPKRYGSTDTFRKTESQETITISKTSRHDVTNTTSKKKDIKRTSQHSLPRSRSPSPRKPSECRKETYEIVTDLDEDVTITTEKQKTGSRPNTLELSKKPKKITDRSPSSPLSDLGSPKKSPTKDLRRTSSFKSPTKDHSPTKYPTDSYKAPKDNLPKSPTRNRPEDRPLKRTDTYEERCRQILGITEVTDKRRSSLERSSSKRSSFRRNTSTNSVDTNGSTSPTKDKPRSPTKSPVKERPQSRDYETTDISTRTTTETTTTSIEGKPRSPSKSPVKERPLSREYDDKPRSPTKERPRSRDFETTNIVTTNKIVDTNKIPRPAEGKPGPTKSPVKERPLSREYDDKPRSPTKERPRSRDFETTNIVTTNKIVDTNKIPRPAEGKPGPTKSPVKERPSSKAFETTDIVSTTTIVDTTEITRPTEGKPRSPLKERPVSRDYDTTDITTTTNTVDTTEITRPTGGNPRSPMKERPRSRDYETTDIDTTTKTVDTTEITRTQEKHTDISSTKTKDITESTETIRPTKEKPKSPVKEKPRTRDTETQDIVSTTETEETTIITSDLYKPKKRPQSPTKGEKPESVQKRPDKKGPNKYPDNEHTTNVQKTTEQVDVYNKEEIIITDEEYKTPHQPITKPNQKTHPQTTVDQTDQTIFSKTSKENISRKDIKNVTEDITEQQEVEIVTRKPINETVDDSPKKRGPGITEFPSQKKPQKHTPTNLIPSKTVDTTEEDNEVVTEETTIYDDNKPSSKGPYTKERPKTTTDRHKTSTTEFIMQEKLSTDINSSTEVLIDESERPVPTKKTPKVKETRPQSTPSGKPITSTTYTENVLNVEEIVDTNTLERKPSKPTTTDDKPTKKELTEYPAQSKLKPKDTTTKITTTEIINKETTKPGEKKEPTKKTPITEFPSQIRKEPKTTTKTSTSITEDISVEEITRKFTKPSPGNKKPTKQGPDTQEKPLKPNKETVKTTEKEKIIKTSKDKVTDEEETIIDELIVVDDSDVPKVTIGKPIPKDEKPKKLPKQHAVDKTTEYSDDDVDFTQEVIVTDEFEIVNIPKQKPKQEIPQYTSQTRKPITKNISKENITPTKEKSSKVKKPTNKEPTATEKFFEPIDYANMVPVEEPLMIKKDIDTSCPHDIRYASKTTKNFIEKEQKEINENVNLQRRPVKPEKETPLHKTQISTTAKKPQKQPERKLDKPSTRKPVNGITEYQDQYSPNLKPKSTPTKSKTIEPTTVFKPSNKINSIPTKPTTKVQVNGFHKPEKPKTPQDTIKSSTVVVNTVRVPKQSVVETITTKKTTKTINLKENEPSEPTKLRKPLPSKGPVKPSAKPSHPDHSTKKHLVTTTITLKTNTQPVTTKPKVSKTTTTTVTKSQKNRVVDLKQKRVNEYVSTDTDEEETIETVDVTKRNGTKRQPEKCITTKTVIINNNTQPRQIVVDLQRSKSSREPTPDKICPVPTEYGGYGSPRYPDEIEEPDDVNVRKPPKRLSDIPLLESEDVTNFSRITEISDTKVVTDIDKVETTDESLLSVNRKINLFLDTADKLTKTGKGPSGPAPKVERPKLEVTQDLESDECLLSVSEKVNKFINTADQFMNVRDLPERPKSPRCKFNNDKISSNNFITTEQKTIQKENLTNETRKVSLENLNTVDTYRKSAPTDIKKEPKSVTRAEKPGDNKPVDKKPSKSPVRESQKTQPELVDQKYPNYSTITKRVSLENLEIQTSVKNTEDIRRKSPERVSPTHTKRPSDRNVSPEDTRNKPSERSSPDRLSPTRITPSHPGTPNRRPPNEYTSIKSIKTQDVKSTTKEVSTTPKSSKSKPAEDKKNILSTTGRLRSTESIKKARALFENINKEAEKANNKSPICTKKETVVRKLSYSSEDDLKQTRTTKSRSNSPDKPIGDVPHYMLPLDRPSKPKSESPERRTSRPRSPDGSESGGIPHYMLPLDRPKTHTPRSKSPDRDSLRSCSPNVRHETGEVPHYMLPLDRTPEPDREVPRHKQHLTRTEPGVTPHYMSPLHKPNTHVPRSKSPDRESLRSCSPNVRHETGEVPHYMLPLDRTPEPDREVPRHNQHLTRTEPGVTPHYMLPLENPKAHIPTEPDREIPRHKQHLTRTEPGVTPHYMLPLENPKAHTPRSKSPDRESLRSCSPNVRHETGEVPHYMLPLDRTPEPDREVPRHKQHLTRTEPGVTPHYMLPLENPNSHIPTEPDRELPRYRQHLTRTEPGVTPHYMFPLENPKAHIPRSKSPDRESLRSSSPHVRHETGEVPHYMLPLDRSQTPSELDRDVNIPRHKQYVTNSTPHYMSPLHRPKTHTPRSNSPDRESLRSCSPNIRHETGEVPHYMLPLDKRHMHSTPRPKSPDRDTPRHKSPESGDTPHYMLPLDRDARPSRPRSKSPGGDSPRHTSPDVRSEASDVPHYMLPLDRNVHYKDKPITTSKPESPNNKFGVTLKKVHPDKPVTKTTNTKVTTERKTSNVENITEEEIEDIFEIEVLEELLQRVTSYEIRRVIRTQIKLVKKLITENRLTIYIQERKQSKIRKDRSETITQNVEYHSSYKQTRKSSTDRTVETRTRSPQRTPSPTRQPKNQFYRPNEKRQSPQRTSSPTKPSNENNLIKTTTTTNTTIRTSTPREIVRKPGERSSPERQSPQRQASPTRTQTTVQSSYRLTSSSDVPTTKQITRKTEELRRFSPERVSLVETTSRTEQVRKTSTEKSTLHTKTTSPERNVPQKKEPRHSSPDKKGPKSGHSILKKTEVQQKKVEEKKPEWVTNRNLKKVTGSNEQVRTTSSSKKTVKEEKIVQKKSSEYEPTDLITSSYGVGPTDENGTPLFGLKALRQTNNGTTKVQGTFITSEYYSENGQEPVGQISVTNYSTDPRDLSTEEQIQNNKLVTSVTTTQKFGYEDSPSLETLTKNKRPTKQIEDSVAEGNRTSNFKRQNSVKAISQKFIDSAVESLKNERQTSYPKAGLILRTSSFKDSKNDSNEEDITSGIVTTTKTSKQTTTKKSTSEGGGTFLSNKSTISGVTDVISRMKTEEYEEGDSSEDIEARSLLNKFIGSQVILSGMENRGTAITTTKSKISTSELVPRTTSKKTIKLTTTVTEGGKTKTKTLVFQSPITEEELENIWDEKILRLLLEQSTEYEERRIIRNRLRSVMAEQEACADLVQKASQEQASGKIEESVTVEKSSSETPTTTTTTKVTKISTQQQVTKKPLSPFAKFQQLDKQNSTTTPPGTPGTPKTPGNGPLFKFTDPALSLSAATIKDRLLYWCKVKTKEYENVQLDNFSTSWADGLAFCALIHHFLPDAFDYHALTPKERRHNFELAFKVASDKADIFPLLDVDDMMATRRPDWKCVFTYVQSIYRRFKDEEI
ncbi:titin [Diabrotica virgifera virgifera]|uniref:Calponin-homology (CH) domain-containing protein n=1 Tax=Diabrotica virgifera virgifera TaxID=50390 RepID=A0ABM5KSJ3_DIAVI|nr:titin [Diabrotica virgifera virgifera]